MTQKYSHSHSHSHSSPCSRMAKMLAVAGMGLGKTASVLAATNHLIADGDMRGLLIVAPLRVAVLTWPDEVEKWTNFRHLKIADLRTKQGKADWDNGTALIYTINYESLPRFINARIKGRRAAELPIDSVLFDEIDNAKNPSSKRIKAIISSNRPGRRICLRPC